MSAPGPLPAHQLQVIVGHLIALAFVAGVVVGLLLAR
jgi:hypothetical protein